MKMVIDLVGVDRAVMGSDFPQLMGVKQPVDFVDSIPGLSRRERKTGNERQALSTHTITFYWFRARDERTAR